MQLRLRSIDRPRSLQVRDRRVVASLLRERCPEIDQRGKVSRPGP